MIHSVESHLVLHEFLCSNNINQLFVRTLSRWLHFIVRGDVAAAYMARVIVMPRESRDHSRDLETQTLSEDYKCEHLRS